MSSKYNIMIACMLVLAWCTNEVFARKEIPTFDDLDEESNMVEPKINFWQVFAKPRGNKVNSLKNIVRFLTLYDARVPYVASENRDLPPMNDEPPEAEESSEDSSPAVEEADDQVNSSSSEEGNVETYEPQPFNMLRIDQENKRRQIHSARFGWTF